MLLLISSIVVLTSCNESPKFPGKYIYEVDLKSGICGKYEIVNTKEMKVSHVGDFDLKTCHGVFGFSSKDMPKIMDWSADIQKYVDQRCK